MFSAWLLACPSRFTAINGKVRPPTAGGTGDSAGVGDICGAARRRAPVPADLVATRRRWRLSLPVGPPRCLLWPAGLYMDPHRIPCGPTHQGDGKVRYRSPFPPLDDLRRGGPWQGFVARFSPGQLC